jgi:hypothetical protein
MRSRGAQIGRGDDRTTMLLLLLLRQRGVAPTEPVCRALGATVLPRLDALVRDIGTGGGPSGAHAVLARQFPVTADLSASAGDARQGWPPASFLGGGGSGGVVHDWLGPSADHELGGGVRGVSMNQTVIVCLP